MLGLCFTRAFPPVVVSEGFCLVVQGLLIVGASLVAEHGHLSLQASVVVVHGLSCPAACGIFADLGLNPYSLHWQTDS